MDKQKEHDTMSDQLTLELPWPPSDNRLTRHGEIPAGKGLRPCPVCKRVKSRVVAFASDEAKEYQRAVHELLLKRGLAKLHGPLRMHVELYPPTRAVIDGPNRMKALMDSLKRREMGRRKKGESPKWDPKQWAWLFANDDSQVVEWSGKLCSVVPGGKAVVTLTKLETAQGEMF